MISVVMPTWNRAHIIQNAIRSIIDQTYKDWELVIADDGSTDATKRIVQNFAHPRIKYHQFEHQNNISRIRNLANEKASGDIIVVQDSDDVSFPDRLEEIAACFENHPEADVVYHGSYMRFIDPFTDSLCRVMRPAQPFERDRLKKEQYIAAQCSYKRKVWEEIPYNEEVPLCDDFIFLLELAYQDKVFVPIYKNLYEYVGSQDSVNVAGELDGRRKSDVQKVLEILKKKYGVEAHATMTRTQVGRGVISQEIV